MKRFTCKNMFATFDLSEIAEVWENIKVEMKRNTI